MTGLPWIFDDGGRSEAGRRGIAEDCVCRAIAIITGKPYAEVYDWLNELGKAERHRRRPDGTTARQSAARTGIWTPTTRKAMAELGLIWHPVMGIGTGCTMHMAVGEVPPGRLIVKLSRHVSAVIDGTVRDIYNPCRHGTRCVYGYYWLPSECKIALGNEQEERP